MPSVFQVELPPTEMMAHSLFCCFLLSFSRQIPVCHGTHFIDQEDLKHRDSPAPAS